VMASDGRTEPAAQRQPLVIAGLRCSHPSSPHVPRGGPGSPGEITLRDEAASPRGPDNGLMGTADMVHG
jgi:hypothetical protein